MSIRRINRGNVLRNDDENKLVFSEWNPIFIFDAPWLKLQGVQGMQKYYQVYLSAANTSSFFSGSLSTVNLSGVNFFSDVSASDALATTYPEFSGFNVKDAGCNVLYSIKT